MPLLYTLQIEHLFLYSSENRSQQIQQQNIWLQGRQTTSLRFSQQITHSNLSMWILSFSIRVFLNLWAFSLYWWSWKALQTFFVRQYIEVVNTAEETTKRPIFLRILQAMKFWISEVDLKIAVGLLMQDVPFEVVFTAPKKQIPVPKAIPVSNSPYPNLRGLEKFWNLFDFLEGDLYLYVLFSLTVLLK